VTERFSVISDGLPTQLPDLDPAETAEWIESLDAVLDHAGRGRARFLMLKMLERAREKSVGVPALRSTDYINTIPRSASRSSRATRTSSGASAPASAGTPRSP
jgi:pyruvate dehydrogenase E1 component